MRPRPPKRGPPARPGRRTPALLAIALLLAAVAPPVLAQAEGPAYIAQSTWGAKHLVKLDRAWLTLRPLWMEKPTGEGVRVAIVDTGVDASHPDLEGAIVLWRDFAGDANGKLRETPYDDHGHGTHVAGVVAARGHFQPNPLKFYWLTGARGVAPAADLIIAKAMSADGRGDDARVAEAILWALDPNGDGDLADGADIINLSIGIEKGTSPTGSRGFNFVGSETRRAVNLALLRGVIVVVSSGNDGSSQAVAEPGDIPDVLAVGAVDREGRLAEFSNGGPTLDVVAPGVLVSTFPKELDVADFAQDGYAGMAGTSMAAPIVTGVVALALEANPALATKGTDKDYRSKVKLVHELVRSRADAIGGERDERQGGGIVDAQATLAAADVTGGAFSWKAAIVLGLIAALLGWGLVAAPIRRRRARKAAAAALDPENGHEA